MANIRSAADSLSAFAYASGQRPTSMSFDDFDRMWREYNYTHNNATAQLYDEADHALAKKVYMAFVKGY